VTCHILWQYILWQFIWVDELYKVGEAILRLSQTNQLTKSPKILPILNKLVKCL